MEFNEFVNKICKAIGINPRSSTNLQKMRDVYNDLCGEVRNEGYTDGYKDGEESSNNNYCEYLL